MGTPVVIRLAPAAAASVKAGHPWVFRGNDRIPDVGAILELHDAQGRRLGWGLADTGPIAVRILGQGPAQEVPRTLEDRIARADAVRIRLVGPDTDAYRVVAAAGDGLPGIVLDRYGDLAVLRIYAAAWHPWLDDVVGAVVRLPWVQTVYRRYGVERVDGRTGGEALHGPEPSETRVVTEHGLRMLVRPRVGQKTGLFLDQREHRALVGRWAAGRTVANLFAYTGGFSVSAALGGAAHVTTVDLAPEAVHDAQENFRLNGLDPAEHAFEVADAFAWSPVGRPDLVIVDPPSFAHDKRTVGAARSAYRKLHRRVGPWIPRDGLLATSSCTARLSRDAWAGAVEEGLAGAWSWHWSSAQAPDHPVSVGHPEGHYLKFGLLRKRG